MVLEGIAITALLGSIWVHSQLSASLPQLNGTVFIEGVQHSVLIERDTQGVPTIHGQTRQDVARATGFLHAQDRFFQMDLLRRQAAGELAELVGKAALPLDRKQRVHRFRQRAVHVFGKTDPQIKALLGAYTEGVNAGLKALKNKPFEYVVLTSEPRYWAPEDVYLVLYAMFIDLHQGDGLWDSHLGVLRDTLPKALVEFLTPLRTEWDKFLTGDEPAPHHLIPTPETFDLRQGATVQPIQNLTLLDDGEAAAIGSNNWAVSGQLSDNCAPLLAGDMHLTHRVPNIWYRASLSWQHQGQSLQVTGVMLPGSPFVVAGSNESIAWSFTNSYGDWIDLVELELVGNDSYITSIGVKKLTQHEEIIHVKDSADEKLTIRETDWGPIIDKDSRGRTRALRWTAHSEEAINLDIYELEQVKNVADAINVANRSGLPPQNFIVVDKEGHIGWTIAGVVPRRGQIDSRFPITWQQAELSWLDWLSPTEYPRLIDPPSGLLWTANSWVLGEEWLTKLGDGGLRLGARAKQIKQDLLSLNEATPHDMLAIQLDDRANFLSRWQTLILQVLNDESISNNRQREEFRQLVENWGGRASPASAGYQLVRQFRLSVAQRVFTDLTQASKQADERFSYMWYGQWEGPLWALVKQQPLHMLSPVYSSWQELFITVIDDIVNTIDKQGLTLRQATWGQVNKLKMRHPLSIAVPALSTWLDMEKVALPGDQNTPRVQSSTSGASQRMVVTPGRESEGLFHMPGGQSGHPLSPFYRAGHDAWVQGLPTPFLPGATRYVLSLEKKDL